MDDYNLKLILKSELNLKILPYIFRELIEENKLAKESLTIYKISSVSIQGI